MANTLAPFGFSQFQGTGSAPTYEMVTMTAAYNAGAIYFGDAVCPVVSTATGNIIQAAASGSSTTALAGIFVGCKYLSVSQKRVIWNDYWPGSDVASTQTVECYVINDPNAQFLCQTSNSNTTATAVLRAKIGQYIGLAVGTGNTANGISGMTADQYTIGTTVTLPFIIKGIYGGDPTAGVPSIGPPGANGTDIASGNNYIIVGFNNILSRANGAGPTGIS
jgi:hypothetical protein